MVVHKIDTSNGWISVDNPKWEITEWIRPVNFMNITKKETVNSSEIFYKYTTVILIGNTTLVPQLVQKIGTLEF